MLRAAAICLAFALVASCKEKGGAENSGWHEVVITADNVRFEFPSPPKEPRIDNVAGARLTTYQAKGPGEDFWQVQTTPLPEFLTEIDAAALDSGFAKALANMLAAMAAIKSSERRVEVHGMPAIEVRANGVSGDREFGIVSRLIVSKKENKLYQLLALRPGGEPDEALVNLFFASFGPLR